MPFKGSIDRGPSATRQSPRKPTPSQKRREQDNLEDEYEEGEIDEALDEIEVQEPPKKTNQDWTMMLAVLKSIKDSQQETQEALRETTKAWKETQKALRRSEENQRRAEENQREFQRETQEALEDIREQLREAKEEIQVIKQAQEKLEERLASPQPSYAEIAKTPPESRPSNLRTLSTGLTTPSTLTDTPICTLDTSGMEIGSPEKGNPGAIRALIEKGMREAEGQENWRCRAVVKDARNEDRIRIRCKDEEELQRVKATLEKGIPPGARVLRDQLYPVKVDNANRTAVLDERGDILPGAEEALGKENSVKIAKIIWLSKKENGKAYGSMAVYVTKGSDATKLLNNVYFDIAGESATTEPFEYRERPKQCFNCQELGHKAFACKKAQRCARCAKEGHSHRACIAEIPQCIPCGGPHESFSRNCPKLYPPRNGQ